MAAVAAEGDVKRRQNAASNDQLAPATSHDGTVSGMADPKLEEMQAEIAAADKSGYAGAGEYGRLTYEEASFLANFPEEKRKKLYRKVDWRLVPMLALLYLFSCKCNQVE